MPPTGHSKMCQLRRFCDEKQYRRGMPDDNVGVHTHRDATKKSSALRGVFHDLVWSHIPLDDLSNQGSIVALYFADGVSDECQKFTKVLSQFYNRIHRDEKMLEIVYISCDPTLKDYELAYRDMPWLALPLNDDWRHKIMRRYNIRDEVDIPALVFVDGSTGDVIFPNGIDKVKKDPNGKDFPKKWHHLE